MKKKILTLAILGTLLAGCGNNNGGGNGIDTSQEPYITAEHVARHSEHYLAHCIAERNTIYELSSIDILEASGAYLDGSVRKVKIKPAVKKPNFMGNESSATIELYVFLKPMVFNAETYNKYLGNPTLRSKNFYQEEFYGNDLSGIHYDFFENSEIFTSYVTDRSMSYRSGISCYDDSVVRTLDYFIEENPTTDNTGGTEWAKNLETIVNGDSYLGELNKKHNPN